MPVYTKLPLFDRNPKLRCWFFLNCGVCSIALPCKYWIPLIGKGIGSDWENKLPGRCALEQYNRYKLNWILGLSLHQGAHFGKHQNRKPRNRLVQSDAWMKGLGRARRILSSLVIIPRLCLFEPESFGSTNIRSLPSKSLFAGGDRSICINTISEESNGWACS